MRDHNPGDVRSALHLVPQTQRLVPLGPRTDLHPPHRTAVRAGALDKGRETLGAQPLRLLARILLTAEAADLHSPANPIGHGLGRRGCPGGLLSSGAGRRSGRGIRRAPRLWSGDWRWLRHPYLSPIPVTFRVLIHRRRDWGARRLWRNEFRPFGNGLFEPLHGLVTGAVEHPGKNENGHKDQHDCADQPVTQGSFHRHRHSVGPDLGGP